MQYAVIELSRGMASPTSSNVKALTRLGGYLIGRTSCVLRFERHTDHARCFKTRRSTIGGILKVGQQLIKSWSHTQAVAALSSSEAEYYGMVKGSSYALGIQALAADTGSHWGSSAAMGIASMMGLEKVKQIEVF